MAHAPPGSARVRLDTHTAAVGLLCRQPCPPGTSSAALGTRLLHVSRGQALASRALPDTNGRSTRCWRRKCLAYVAGPEVEAPKVPSPPTYVKAPGRIVASKPRVVLETAVHFVKAAFHANVSYDACSDHADLNGSCQCLA